ncbi:ferredoxin--NADP reductase [Candidatus Nitrosacidococcus sp. I8]|uniref:ferredoxin--NADP reductase n=1 Tax=Candidatus Nitrosacidococcus sp. I8 TaxID=2942908 RepID=UPI0022273301|nr:ferredoxin--NADP reductase [Candidatus Nitrosacidococcus sp. I8]CAH9018216.1 Flavodoxin/ferredoxin--NADP reductase [Candidatus Nitrosacidococcus sp. I8]
MTASIVDIDKWVEGKVISNHFWTESLYSLQVEAPINPFEAGQFGRLGLVINEEFIARSYSFVNMPEEKYLEFYSIIVSEGLLSPRLAELKPGDSVWVFRKGSGFLTMPQVQAAHDLWMLSTGTAIGPFLAVLKADEVWKKFSKIILAHSVRSFKELSYRPLIQSIQEKHSDQFIYVPLVSREEHENTIHGRITTAIEDGRMSQFTGLEIKSELSQVMICGNPDMVKDVTAILKNYGLKENKRRIPGEISIEKYW